MIAEVRIYTMNRGKLDDFVKLWNEKLAPIHAKYGLKILGAWVNRPQNEFIWMDPRLRERGRSRREDEAVHGLARATRARRCATEARSQDRGSHGRGRVRTGGRRPLGRRLHILGGKA